MFSLPLLLALGCSAVPDEESEPVESKADNLLGDSKNTGLVYLAGDPDFPGWPLVFADFAKDGVENCVTEDHGACSVYICSGSPGGTPTDAGELRIRNLTKKSGVLLLDDVEKEGSLKPDPTTHQYPTGLIFAEPGDKVRIRAMGNRAGAPAFAVTLTAPTPINVVSPIPPENPHPDGVENIPMLPDALKLKVDRSKDLTVTWTGGDKGKVEVNLGTFRRVVTPPPFDVDGGPTFTPLETVDSRAVQCTFDPKKGSGVVPAKLLAFLAANSAETGIRGFMTVDSVSSAVTKKKAHRRRWAIDNRIANPHGSSDQILFQ